MTNRVFISGATGYVGRFLKLNLDVAGFNTYPISLFKNGKLIRFEASGDFTDACLVHLSESANANTARLSSENLYTAQKNIECFKAEFKKIIYFSSCAVYDTVISGKHTEASTRFSQAPYAAFKLAIERQLRPTKDLIIRPSNLYAKRLKRGTILSDLLVSTKYGGISSLRKSNVKIDFINLKYVSRMVEMALSHDICGVLNCTSGQWVTGSSLISAFSEQSGRDAVQSSAYSNDKLLGFLKIERIPTIIEEMERGEVFYSE